MYISYEEQSWYMHSLGKIMGKFQEKICTFPIIFRFFSFFKMEKYFLILTEIITFLNILGKKFPQFARIKLVTFVPPALLEDHIYLLDGVVIITCDCEEVAIFYK